MKALLIPVLFFFVGPLFATPAGACSESCPTNATSAAAAKPEPAPAAPAAKPDPAAKSRPLPPRTKVMFM